MRTLLPLGSLLFLASLGGLLAAPTGCATASDNSDSSESNVEAADLATARSIVNLLGGDEGRCSSCHEVNETKLRAWGTAMKNIDTACIQPEGLAATDRVNCLRVDPNNPASAFGAKRLGLYAAAASGSEMKGIFESAFPGSTAEHAAFARKVNMPRSGDPVTTEEFAKIKDWVLRGMPALSEAFQPVTEATCTPSTTPELAAHISAMKTQGWGARLADQATPMFGCGEGSTMDCLSSFPESTTTWGNSSVTQKLRTLHKQSLQSHWWVRSSADGRYLGYGLGDSAKIVDLSKPDSAAAINVDADYDPYFLANNEGFAFAGSHDSGSIVMCRQSLLADVGQSAAPSISLTENKCARVGRDVYMSIGAALDGERFFMTFGAHQNDDGGSEITRPLSAAFGQSAKTTFTPMVNDGLSYRAQRTISVSHPNEGDMMLSPSGIVGATRFGDGRKPRGYRLRFIKPVDTASGLTIQTPVAAEICIPGQKAAFSFDERFLTTHQYVDRSEPEMANLNDKSSNIIVTDLVTGKQVRITTSKTNEFALYPHFRADGWLYFLVRDMNTRTEYSVASDIALRMAAE